VRRMVGWMRHAKVLEVVNATILLRLLSLSGVRYLVFILQYLLLFGLFGIDINWWQAFWAISVVFLVIAILPGMGFLSELGIRWVASVQMLQLFSSNVTGIFATSLVIWIVNLVIPAIIGGILIMRLKLIRKKTKEMQLYC
jgi:general stress protein CsbA